MLKFDDYNASYSNIPEYNFEDSSHYLDNILNGETDFKSTITNQLIIGENSDGIQKATASGSLLVPYDILGILRTSPADIGAYQHIQF